MSKAKSFLWSYTDLFTKTLLGFFFIPVFKESLGIELYGLYVVNATILSYLVFLDSGLNQAALRYIIKWRNNKKDLVFVGSILFIYLGIFLFASICCLIYYFQGFQFWNLGKELTSIAREIFIPTSTALCLGLLLSPQNAALMAFDRYDIIKRYDFYSYLLSNVGAIIILFISPSLVHIVWWNSIVTIAILIIKSNISVQLSGIKYSIARFYRKEFNEIFKYSFPIILNSIAELIFWRLDIILVNFVLGPEYVAIYSFGLFFKKHLQSLGSAISKIYIPDIISSYDNYPTGETVDDKIVLVGRAQLLVYFPLILFLIFFGEQFFHLWLDLDNNQPYFVMVTAVLPFIIFQIGNVRRTTLEVNKRFLGRSLVFVLLACSNALISWWVLAKYHSLVIAATVTGLSLLILTVYEFRVCHSYGTMNVGYFFNRLGSNLLKPLVIVIVLFTFLRVIPVNDLLTWFGMALLAMSLSYLIFVRLYLGFSEIRKYRNELS